MKLTKKGEITMVMGDFNSKLGRGAEGEYVEAFGLGEKNSRGDRLLQFCTENCLFAANTFFKQRLIGDYIPGNRPWIMKEES